MFENHIVELEANMYDNYRLEETIGLSNLARILERLTVNEKELRLAAADAWLKADHTEFESNLVYHTATSDAITIIQETINKLRYVY